MHSIKLILNYYKEQEKEFLKNFIKARSSNDENAIHDMRVATKRIRALFIFLENTSEHVFRSKKHYSFFKEIFKASGQIRDLQIQLKIIESTGKKINFSPTEYILFLEKQKDIAEQNFLLVVKKIDIEYFRSMSKLIKANIKKINSKKMHNEAFKFLMSKAAYTSKIKQKPVGCKKWHQIRTQVKQLLYVSELICHFFGSSKEMLKLQKKLKDFGELLGNWHDKDVAYVNLREFINGNTYSKTHQKSYTSLLNSLNNSF